MNKENKTKKIKENWEKNWKRNWKEFYGLYGDIGRSEEDIKDFFRQALLSQRKEILKRNEKRKEIWTKNKHIII